MTLLNNCAWGEEFLMEGGGLLPSIDKPPNGMLECGCVLHQVVRLVDNQGNAGETLSLTAER